MKHALSGVLRGSPARALHIRCRSVRSRTAARTVVALYAIGVRLVGIHALGLHVNLFARARRLCRMVAASRVPRGQVVVSVGHVSPALACARGYLGPGPYAGGVQPVFKPVVAVAGDLVEGGPEAVTVNRGCARPVGARCCCRRLTRAVRARAPRHTCAPARGPSATRPRR